MNLLFRNILILLIIISFTYCQKIPNERSLKIETSRREISNNNLTIYGNIIDLPDRGIEDHGFIYSIDTPNIGRYKISLGSRSSRGNFSAKLNQLPAEKVLYFRAYAKLNDKYYFGENVEWLIYPENVKIEVGSPKIENAKNVSISGNISDLGSFGLMEFGHCYSFKPNASMDDFKLIAPELNQNGEFVSIFNQLPMDTLIYVRTYAKLSDKFSPLYSQEISFFLPTLKINTDTSILINANTARMQGNLISVGLDGITEYGFVWSIQNPFPNYNDQKLVQLNPAKNGPFYQNLENLIPDINYYYRAFASNGSEVFYGKVKYFKP